jgi:FOG: PKD repeat
VDDNSGTACNLDSAEKTIKVNSAPAAEAGRDITMCLKSLDEDYTVNLDGSSSRDPDGDSLSYSWNLGDGSTARGERVSHAYRTSGIYKVTLMVDDGSGLACSGDSDSLTVNLNKSPVAEAGPDKSTCLGQSVSFDGTASKTEPGESLTYNWDFGDGVTSSGSTVSLAYDKGGKYKVMLTVDDCKGTPCSSSTDYLHVNINSRPVCVLE